MIGDRLAAALEEAFLPSEHPRARGGKFAQVLAKGQVLPVGAFGPMSRSSFGGNLHRIKLDAGGGEHYSFDRRPSGIWHHTFTSNMGGTSFVSPSVPLSPDESKKLDAIDLAAAKKDIADTKDPERRKRLEAHVKGGYFTGPSALKDKAFRDYTTGRRKKLPDGSDPVGARRQPELGGNYFVQPSDWRQPQTGRDPRWGMGVV